MEITMDKCNGCIYYHSMYLMCTKPYDVLCPKEELPNSVICPRERDCVAEKSSIPIKTHRCIICNNDCIDSMDAVCDECKEAIKKLKEMLRNEN